MKEPHTAVEQTACPKKPVTSLLPTCLVINTSRLGHSTTIQHLHSRIPTSVTSFGLSRLSNTSLRRPNRLVSSTRAVPFYTSFHLIVIGKTKRLTGPISRTIIDCLTSPGPRYILYLITRGLTGGAHLCGTITGINPRSIVSYTPLGH